MQPDEQTALVALETIGYEVERLEVRPGRRTADFRAVHERESLVVEVKGKHDAEDLLEERRKTHEAGEVFEHATSVARQNSISGIIGDGAKQLDATASKEELRLLWLHPAGFDAPGQSRQLRSSLFGERTIAFHPGDTRKLDARPCYFFGMSDFYRHPDLDMAVLFDGRRGFELCINTYSSRLVAMRTSLLYRAFAKEDAVRDPEMEEQESKAFLADCGADVRGKPGGVLDYVKRKHDLAFVTVLSAESYSAEVKVTDPPQKTRGGD